MSYSPPRARGVPGRGALCSPGLAGTTRRAPAARVSLWNRAECHCIITTVWLKVPFFPLIYKGSVPHLLCPHKPGKGSIDKGCDHRKGSAETDGNSAAGRPCPVQIDKCQSATRVCSSLVTPSVSQPGKGVGTTADATLQKAKLTCPAAWTRSDFRHKSQRMWDKDAMRLTSAGASPVLQEVQRPWVSPDPSMNLTPSLPSPVAEHGVRGLAGRSSCPCLGCASHSPWRRARRCQGWQALRWEHSQGLLITC